MASREVGGKSHVLVCEVKTRNNKSNRGKAKYQLRRGVAMARVWFGDICSVVKVLAYNVDEKREGTPNQRKHTRHPYCLEVIR